MSSIASTISSTNRTTKTAHTRLQSRPKCYLFDGHERTLHTLELEKDNDFWQVDGDCFVYLDNNDTATYRLSLASLEQNKACTLLKSVRKRQRSQSPGSCDSSDSGYESAHLTTLPEGPYDLHISTPAGENPLDYHLTTRNYLAYLDGKPLLGTSLGLALRDVWSRIQRWHEEDADIEAFLDYCKKQKYTELINRPYNATALLAFAESAQLRDVWINAFAHCVGMHDRIGKDSDFDALTFLTRAMITKASLAMELHIRRVVRTIGTFLEGELSSEKLGLSKPARDHLDHFRSFLHTFFLDKLGYFPPTDSEDNFDKTMWMDIHDDFKSLYDYLVDKESVNDVFSNRAVIGGVCVHQNVDAFNQRHKLEPLPHPLPLLPDMTPTRRTTESQVSIRNFKLVRVESDFRPSIKQALTTASNSEPADLLDRPIVEEYIRFERQKLEEKLTIAEARKIRWLLIYCTLQMLTSLVSAPKEVVDAASAPYPLCVSTAGCPIGLETVSRSTSAISNRNSASLSLPASTEDTDHISIHPDCEADNAQDFFSLNRRGSAFDKSEDEAEPQSATRSTPSLARSLSIRTGVNAIQKSVIGSLARRNSVRKSVQLTPKRVSSLQDIVNEDEDMAFDRPITATPTAFSESSLDLGFSAQENHVPSVPLLEDHLLDMLTPIERPHTPPWQLYEDEHSSPVSDASPRSSTLSEYDTPVTESSSRSSSTRESKLLGNLAPLEEDCILETASRPRTAIHTSASTTSLNAGCYKPSGMIQHDTPLSRFAAPSRRQVYERRAESFDHTKSFARESKRPLHDRYARKRSNTDNVARYTWGDLP